MVEASYTTWYRCYDIYQTEGHSLLYNLISDSLFPFYRLRLPCLDMESKWKEVVALFVKDLLFVQGEYNAHKHNPPLNRDLPPLVGKIVWARQLYHRISQPLAALQQKEWLMQQPETRKAVKSFNKLAQV